VPRLLAVFQFLWVRRLLFRLAGEAVPLIKPTAKIDAAAAGAAERFGGALVGLEGILADGASHQGHGFAEGPEKNKLGKLIEPEEAQRPWVQYPFVLTIRVSAEK